MYRELGFMRVWGGLGERGRGERLRLPDLPAQADRRLRARSGSDAQRVLRRVPRRLRPYGSARLPDSDDVLAKWMALTADERGLIADANMHLPGRQVDPERVRRDLVRLARWEPRARRARAAAARGRRRRGSRATCAPAASISSTAAAPSPRVPSGLPRAPTCTASATAPRTSQSRSSAWRTRGSRRCPATSTTGAGGEGQGGHPRRRGHADGAQHDRDLRRDHDGHHRHARLAGVARADRRLDRARRLGACVRRAGDDLRLRQDDPGHRDGARAPGHPRADALRRLDPARSLQGRRGHDPAGVRGGRRARRRARSPRRSCTSWRRRPRRARARAAGSSRPTRWRWPSRCSGSRPPARRWFPPRTGASSRSRASAANW